MTQRIELRRPRVTDGAAVHRLIARCPPLDTNSRYCNLLQCTHFADSSVVATRADAIVGFISGYIEPAQRDTLFVWQVAVAPECRGQGLARSMLTHILKRETCRGVDFIETSITPDNEASWRTFRSSARRWGAPLDAQPWLSSEPHFEGKHESELLVRIGPIGPMDPPGPTHENRTMETSP